MLVVSEGFLGRRAVCNREEVADAFPRAVVAGSRRWIQRQSLGCGGLLDSGSWGLPC